MGRNTQGVRLMKLSPDESIATISKVYKEDPVDDLEEDGENGENGENQMTLVNSTEKE